MNGRLDFEGVDEVGKFFVVTRPTRWSVLGDIHFSTDVFGLICQFKGGLDPSEIVGLYNDKGRSHEVARKLLADRDMGRR